MRRLTLIVLAVVSAGMLLGGARGATSVAGWTTYGNGPERDGVMAGTVEPPLRRSFLVPLAGRVTSQVLAVRGVPAAGLTTLYATTSDGRVYAVSADGYVRWVRDFGQLAHDCRQLDGWGITGTPVIDALTRTLYTVDAWGRLHALNLATGAERPGWPAQVVQDFEHEHVWGALLLADGHVFVPTGSYCDTGPMQGHVYAVDLATHGVRSWAPVPTDLGGGGGIWGWGGIAYSARRDSLFVATGNAFPGGTNVGGDYRETAGYGEHIVELSPSLEVRAASTTPEPNAGDDADLVGSPVVFDVPGCGELVAAIRKDGRLFAWHADDVAAGPSWQLPLEQFDDGNPVLSQLAFDPAVDALIVVTGTQLARVDVRSDCSAQIAWSQKLGTSTENGLPTIAGHTIWFVESGKWSLLAVDDRTGAVRFRAPLAGPVLTAPTILDGRLYVGSFAGQLHGFATPAASPAETGPTSSVRGHRSDLTARLDWVSRENGVFASDDGGKHWREIYPAPALSVLRVTRESGLITVGFDPSACSCRPRFLWTADGGRSWHATNAVAGEAAGSGSSLFWRNDAGTTLSMASWPPRDWRIGSHVVYRAHGRRIVDLATVPHGVAALLSARVDGRGWDETPEVLLYRNGRATTVTLPSRQGSVLVRTISAVWPTLVVTGSDFDADGAIEPLVWRSRDGGKTWTSSG